MLGRMLEPIGLLEDVRQMFMEYLTKNAKKLVCILRRPAAAGAVANGS